LPAVNWRRLDRKFILGLNYWPRKAGPRMWFRWDTASIAEDLRIIKSLGVRAVRFFLLLQDIVNPHAEPHSEIVGRVAEFLKLLKEYGLEGFATVLVGHMSGRNWGIPFQPREGVYTPSFLRRLERFLEALLSNIGGEYLEQVKAWVLSNELMLYAKPRSTEEYLGFVSAAVRAIKSLDPGKPVGLGDVAGPGTEAPNAARICDYCGYHLYYYDADPVRHGLAYAFATDLYSMGGNAPVIAEEVGFSSAQFSDGEISGFLRSVLASILANGASGAFIWCFSDFDLDHEAPYLWKPFELRFGVVDAQGRPKEQGRVIKEFSKLLEELEGRGIYPEFEPLKDPVTIVYPAFTYDEVIEFVGYGTQLARGPALEAYTVLKTMGINPLVLPEHMISEATPKPGLVMVPSTPTLLSTTWRVLERLARDGSTLYYSFVKHAQHPHDSPTHLWRELFGVIPDVPAGSPGAPPPSRLLITYRRTYESLSVPQGRGDVLGYLFKPVEASVIGLDYLGKPQIFLREIGEGHAVLASVPLEALAYDALRADTYRGELLKAYEVLVRVAGIKPRVIQRSEGEGLETVAWGGGGDEVALFIINHSHRHVESSLELAGGEVRSFDVVGALGNARARPEGTGVWVSVDGKSSIVLLARLD